MRKIRCILLYTLLFWIAAHSISLGQLELKIAPSVVDLSLGRGGTKVFSFEIINDNKELTQTFSVMPMDVDVDRGGNAEFLPPGKVAFGCGNWLQAEPSEVTVGPGQAKKVVGKLSIPASVRAGGYYGAIVCELADKSNRKSAAGSIIKWQIACLLKVSVIGGKIDKKAYIEDLRLQTLFETREERDKGLTFVAALRNEGNIHVAADGKLTVLTPERMRKGEVAFNVGTGTVLPGRTRDFVAVYDRLLAEGSYIARATFRYGGTSTLEKEIPFTVTSKALEAQEGQQNIAAVSVIKINPSEVRLKIPAGGFRTIGVELQNQSGDEVRVRLQADPDSAVRTWFNIEPEELLIPGGRASKIVLRCSVPDDSQPQSVKTSIKADLARIGPQGNVEPVDPQTIGINLEIPEL